jgi:hypothetical protein
LRLQILDLREGTQMIMMIMISTYLNHQSDLRSPFVFNLKSAIANLKLNYLINATVPFFIIISLPANW